MKIIQTAILHAALAALAASISACHAPESSIDDELDHHDRRVTTASVAPRRADVRPSGVYRPARAVQPPAEQRANIDAGGVLDLIRTSGVPAGLRAASEVRYSHPGASSFGPDVVAALADGEPGAYDQSLDRARGVLYLKHASRAFGDVDPGRALDRAAIEEKARLHLDALGIRLEEGGTLVARPLMRQRTESDEPPTMVAWKVFVELAPLGVPVQGPRVVLSYFLDGMLHKALVRWPTVQTDTELLARPLDEADVSARVRAALSTHPLGTVTTPLSLRVGLIVDGIHLRRALFVEGQLDNAGATPRGGQLIIPL